MIRLHVERWGIGTREWCWLGFVQGVFYVWRYGVTIKLYGTKRERWIMDDGTTILRLWPFVIVRGATD